MSSAPKSFARRAATPGLIALLSGFAVMVVELTAVRALAPSFGDSVPVWTNVIGVILLALALGAVCGGWFADRGLGGWLLPGLLLVAGAAVFAIPFLVPRVAQWILPATLPLDRALPVLVEGSLAVGLVVFAPPVLLLGAVSPMLIQRGSRGHLEAVGRVSGVVYAAGTVGSLAGTFLATHVLVPRIGIDGAFLVAGGSLWGAGVIALVSRHGAAAIPAAAAALLPALLIPVAPPPPVWLVAAEGASIVAERDSYYQRLWVVEAEEEVDGRRVPVRILKINEGLDSFHSVWMEGTAFTNGRYFDSFGLLPYLIADKNTLPARVRVLSLGCAAGSILRILRNLLGERLVAVGVDLDPDVIALGHRWFALPAAGPQLQLVGDLDARVYVERVDVDAPQFDLVCVDTYRHQIYLPAHLASVEFFRAVRRRLSTSGVLALNVGDLDADGPVLRAVAGTLASVFPCVESFHVAGSRNFLVFAHGGEPGRMSRSLVGFTRPSGFPEWLWEQGKRPGACRSWAPLAESERLTDQRSDLGRLHERMYSRLPCRPGS